MNFAPRPRYQGSSCSTTKRTEYACSTTRASLSSRCSHPSALKLPSRFENGLHFQVNVLKTKCTTVALGGKSLLVFVNVNALVVHARGHALDNSSIAEESDAVHPNPCVGRAIGLQGGLSAENDAARQLCDTDPPRAPSYAITGPCRASDWEGGLEARYLLVATQHWPARAWVLASFANNVIHNVMHSTRLFS